MEGAFVGSAITHEADGHFFLLGHLEGQGYSRGHRHATADNGNSGYHTLIDIAHVHRAAFALAAAGGFAEKLAHHLFDRQPFG